MLPSLLFIHLQFDKLTENSLVIAFVGYLIVFAALVILYYVFRLIPELLNIKIRYHLKKEGKECADLEDFSVSDEVNAAIATALHLYYEEQHDDESNIITVRRISKTYSPWSSKIYGLRTFRK